MLRRSVGSRCASAPSSSSTGKNFAQVPPRPQLPSAQLLKEGYKFQIPHAVMWTDLDMLNHVNNTTFFRWYDQVRIQYFTQILGLGVGLSCQTKVGSIMGSIDCKFRRPLTFPDELILAARVLEIKQDRVVMSHAVWSERQQTVAAVGSGVIVCYDYGQNKVAAVPEDWTEKILCVEGKESVKISTR